MFTFFYYISHISLILVEAGTQSNWQLGSNARRAVLKADRRKIKEVSPIV
jgi:hypothetical protein